MRTLIVEDDFTHRRLMQLLLRPYGECDIAVDGEEAVQAFNLAVTHREPYDLVCLDIQMPKLDGRGVLKAIRAIEAEHGTLMGRGVKVIMTTALGDPPTMLEAFHDQCDGYLVKPINRSKLVRLLNDLSIVDPSRPEAGAA